MSPWIRSAIAVAVLSGCNAEPSDPIIPGPLASAPPVVLVHERQPVVENLFNPCTGESIRLTGTLHLRLMTVVDAAGGEHTRFHSNLQDVEAVGLATGRRYRVVNTSHTSENLPASGASVVTAVMNLRVIAQGRAENLAVRALFHVTLDARGVERVVIERVETECRGGGGAALSGA
jgi:hypothetical protein